MSRFDLRDEAPTVIGLSGGRTSAYMLWRILDASGGLPPHVYPVFTDTEEECPETYTFLDSIERAWGVRIVRLKRGSALPLSGYAEYAGGVGIPLEKLTQVDFLLEDLRHGKRVRGKPMSVFGGRDRSCSVELKHRVMERWACAEGLPAGFVDLMGIRADEPSRAVRLRGNQNSRPVYRVGGEPWYIGRKKAKGTHIGRVEYEQEVPLADAGVTASDVFAFWAEQPFDLGFASRLGNCDGCPQKNTLGLMLMALTRPERMRKWAKREAFYQAVAGPVNGRFKRSIKRDYAALLDEAAQVREVLTPEQIRRIAEGADDADTRSYREWLSFGDRSDDATPCMCTD